MSETLTPPFEARLTPPELSKGEREYQTFLRLLPQLLGTHRGQYVAIHDGQVVDSDTDDDGHLTFYDPSGVLNVELERLTDAVQGAGAPRYWRMLGRLQKSWIGRRDRNGFVTVSRYAPAGCVLYGGWPYLRLARGHYRMTVRGTCGKPRDAREAVLGIEVFANGRQCLAIRVYPGRRDSVGVALRSVGQDTVLTSLDAWQMANIYR